MSDDNFYALLKVLLVIFMMLGAAGLGASCSDSDWKRESIEKGFAEYNQVTGEWQWKPNLLKDEK